jgi:hypothetical protein
MVWTDLSGWRLKTIIFMVIVLGSIYVINALFVTNMTLSVNNYQANGSNVPTRAPNAMQIFFSVMFFGYVQIGWLAFLLSMFTVICWVVVGYISYTFLKDALPW